MRTTFSRTFFPAALLLLIALLLVGASFQLLVKDYLVKESYQGLENDGTAIAALASAYYTDGSLSTKSFLVNLTVASQVSEADAIIFDTDGRLILCSDSPFGCEHQGWTIDSRYVEQVIAKGTAQHTGIFSGLYDDARYVVSVPILDVRTNNAIGIVTVSTSMQATSDILDKLSDIYLFVSILSVIAVMLIMSIFARRHSTPLLEMAQAASAFGHGDLSARVSVKSSYPQEVEELALAFNNMASSLQKSEYQRKEFVANVSHELKTPMTVIDGYIDGMLDGTIPQDQQSHYMRLVSEETKRLSRLVRSMLDISRLQDQGGIPDEKKTQFDIEECAGQVLITFEQKILQKGVNVEVDMPEHPVYTIANQDYITQVIYNLLDNAVKFCPSTGTIGISIKEGSTKAYVSVFNDGETIPAEELPLLFDRFHKTDKSRSQNRDGWGLGLYIVKTIVCSHGEDISVSSMDGKTEFTFTLPLVN
jgi:signal transduction histidine kinase